MQINADVLSALPLYLRAEIEENILRKDFTQSELANIERQMIAILSQPEFHEQGKRTDLTSTSFDVEVGRPARYENTTEKVAKLFGEGERTVRKRIEIVQAAEDAPELFSDLVAKMDDSGKVDGAYKEMKKRKKVAAKAAVPSLPMQDARYRLVHSNIASLEIEPETVDVIITDPPYPKEYLPLYDELARKATVWLKPGGSLLAMVGQSYLPEIICSLEQYLTYQWTLAYLTPGGQSPQIWLRKVNTFWKPVLWFVKGNYSGDWIGDVAKSETNDKRFHNWGQSESGMADLMERFTYPGQLVCDPFVGGGTVAVVALTMNRLFIGADIDPQAIQTTKERIIECLKLGKNAQGGVTRP